MKIKIILFLIFFFLLFDTSFANNWGNWGNSSVSNSSSGSSSSTGVVIPDLTWEIHFYSEGIWEIPISFWDKWGIWGTPIINWEYGESLFNDFINKDIEVSLHCTSLACDPDTYTWVLINENWTWSLTIEDKYGRTLTKNFHVRKINKTKPKWELVYSPDYSAWVNSSKLVTLIWEATIFGIESFNRDWLIWNSSPSRLCDIEWWCSWLLSIKDSAGNIFIKAYNIINIDKTLPTIHINKYAEIDFNTGRQKIGISCQDTWWSWCAKTVEVIKRLQLWTTSNQCVYDKAWNSMCSNVTTDQSQNDYSDSNLNRTAKSRKIYLICQDEPGGSWCVVGTVSKIIPNNIYDTSLTIRDNAWNSLTKHFQISKIDKDIPIVTITSINWINSFKASEQDKIKINATDESSWINKISYKWDNSCINWENINWTSVNNNETINYTIAWNHKLYVCAIDKIWNIKEEVKNFTIYPWDLNENNTEIEVSSKGDKIADNIEQYEYLLKLKDIYGNIIYNKEAYINSKSTVLLTNMIPPISWDNALTLNVPNNKSDNNWKIKFYIKSVSPWDFTQNFKISMNNWWDNYINNSTTTIINKDEKSNKNNSFMQPLIWNLSVIEWWTIPEIGKNQKYKISLSKVGNASFSFSNWSLYISKDTIIHKTPWHIWNTFWWIDNFFWNDLTNNLWFSWSINANSNILSAVKLWINKLIISYTFESKDIKYYLNDFWIGWCDTSTLWLKVIWTLQWDWKSDITWQDKNFSDLSKFSSRTAIRMNGYKLIRWLKSWDIINWVKYVQWNIDISWDLPYETLVVKDWNVIISWDLNTTNKKLWIIVLKDNYLVGSDYNKNWNIYINKDVTKINAIIYSDWAFRSANSSWQSYSDSDLEKQLELNWTLFTRNTIWWAISAWWKYLLPWWQETTDYDLAEIYDLNFTRKIKDACSDPSFIIKYNWSVQSNPPVGFSIK